MENNAKMRKITFILGWILIISIILLTTFYILGYRRTEGLKIGKIGQLIVKSSHEDTLIYIDERKKIYPDKDGDAKISLSPKIHSIIIHKADYFPWKKDILIESDKKIEISPVFVSQNPSGNIITKIDPEYWKLITQINNNYPSTKENPKISEDNETKTYIENNTIILKNNDEEIEIISPEEKIMNLDFYKNRNDVVIFSAGNGVYAIEASKKGGQNFMPIYKGDKPKFVKIDNNFIYIFDMGSLMQVII